jgi:hypothetical protein
MQHIPMFRLHSLCSHILWGVARLHARPTYCVWVENKRGGFFLVVGVFFLKSQCVGCSVYAKSLS